jgi:hypothetical protein
MANKDGKPDWSSPWPCPAWCAGDDILTEEPDEGVVHSSSAETLAVTGNADRPGSQRLAVLIETWTSCLTARPSSGLITWSLEGTWGPHLTPAETRRFIRLLDRLAGRAEAA